MRSLELWSSVYLAYNVSCSHNKENDCPPDAPPTSSSLQFPLNFSYSNLDMKPYVSTHLNSSKSDGDLLRPNMIKKCAPLDHVITASVEHDLPEQSNGHSNTCVNGDVCDKTYTGQNGNNVNSLYYSTTTEEQDVGLTVETCSPEQLVSSMNSSAATIIQGDSDNEEHTTEDSISDNITFGRTLKEFGANSRCRQDSSSYEHLAASLGDLNHTGDNDNNLDNCNNLDKTSENGQSSNDTTEDNTTKEISIQTVDNEKAISTQSTQTSDSIATLKTTMSNMYVRYLDNDGLTLMHNEVQDRLRQIEMVHLERLEALHAQLLEERCRRLAVCNHGELVVPTKATDLNDEVVSTKTYSRFRMSGRQYGYDITTISQNIQMFS